MRTTQRESETEVLTNKYCMCYKIQFTQVINLSVLDFLTGQEMQLFSDKDMKHLHAYIRYEN